MTTPTVPAAAPDLLRGAFDAAGADEGTLWLLDDARRALVPVWNSGPHPGRIVGQFAQPLDAGLISIVCVAEQAVCENAVYRHAGQDPALDRKLSLLTCSMIAVPYRPGGEVAGVVSCVKLKRASEFDAPDPPPFDGRDLERVERAVRALEKAAESGAGH